MTWILVVPGYQVCYWSISITIIWLQLQGLLLWTCINCVIPAWVSNHMPSEAWDEITYPFPNFNGVTVEVPEWISNFIPYFIMDVITNPCWGWSVSMLIKGDTGRSIQINPLWPSDVIWRQGYRSTLAQVMACCLTATSHYLSQCWLMISEVLWHSPDSNSTEKILIIEMSLKVKSPRGQWVNFKMFLA